QTRFHVTGVQTCALPILLVDRASVPFAGGVTMGPDRRAFELQYTALSFVNPEQMRFRYMLEGLDKEWQDAGTRRTAYYSYVPPRSEERRVGTEGTARCVL